MHAFWVSNGLILAIPNSWLSSFLIDLTHTNTHTHIYVSERAKQVKEGLCPGSCTASNSLTGPVLTGRRGSHQHDQLTWNIRVGAYSFSQCCSNKRWVRVRLFGYPRPGYPSFSGSESEPATGYLPTSLGSWPHPKPRYHLSPPEPHSLHRRDENERLREGEVSVAAPIYSKETPKGT